MKKFIPIISVKKIDEDHGILINKLEITNDTWSYHYDIMYLSKHGYYHFVHVMYNQKGMIVKESNKDKRMKYVFFDAWPSRNESSALEIRFFLTNDPEEADKYFMKLGFPKKVDSRDKMKRAGGYWKDIAEYFEKVMNKKYGAYIFKNYTFEEIEEFVRSEKYNSALFCKRFWECMKASSVMGNKKNICVDTELVGAFGKVLLKLIEYQKKSRNDEQVGEQSRLSVLLQKVDYICHLFLGGDVSAIITSSFEMVVYAKEVKYINDEKAEIGRLKLLLKDKKFEDFVIFKRLGISKRKGFYGVNCGIYLCGLENFNDIFAMKIVLNYGYDNTNAIDENLLEIEKIDIPFHRNIASCLHSFIDIVDYKKLPKLNVEVELAPKTSIFIFKYYPRTLANYIHLNNHDLSNLDIVEKLSQLIEGICHLKKYMICHRDLKPDNVFLDWDCTKVIIADFGCCLKCEELGFRFQFNSIMSQSFCKGGAPHYLSPEILNCKGGTNCFIDYSKNDIFSVGLIGCKMIQKEDVFTNNNQTMLELKKNLKVDERIIDFLKKLICVDPDERYDCEKALKEINILMVKLITERT